MKYNLKNKLKGYTLSKRVTQIQSNSSTVIHATQTAWKKDGDTAALHVFKIQEGARVRYELYFQTGL